MSVAYNYWSLVMDTLKGKISSNNFKAWFSRLDFVGTKNHGRKIILSVPSKYTKKHIEEKFSKELIEAINSYYPKVIHVELEIQIDESKIDDQKTQDFIVPEFLKKDTEAQQSLDLVGSLKELPKKSFNYLPKVNLTNLNPKYTFDNFVVTDCNQLAISVAESIVKQPGSLYNPVFIYAGVGLGKTHLLQAIGEKTLSLYPDFKIKYTTSETFFNFFISGIRNKKSEEFKNFYRSIDLLLIDDIQFFADKEGTQEAFFHTFNELHQNNKQIVITSDKHPKHLNGIAERLVSRFTWGMVIDINKPNMEDRLAITKDKVERMRLAINPDQVFKIADKVDTHIRDIEGVLNRIQARLSLIPDKALEDYELDKILTGFPLAAPMQIQINRTFNSPQQVLEAVSKVFSLSKEDLISKNRAKDIALARQVAMYLCKSEWNMSFPSIGKLFGGKDHTTVIHSCKKIESLIGVDTRLQDQIKNVREVLKGAEN